jgi:hypothetical protein
MSDCGGNRVQGHAIVDTRGRGEGEYLDPPRTRSTPLRHRIRHRARRRQARGIVSHGLNRPTRCLRRASPGRPKPIGAAHFREHEDTVPRLRTDLGRDGRKVARSGIEQRSSLGSRMHVHVSIDHCDRI